MDGNQDFKVLFSCPALGIARNDFMMKIFPQLLKKEYVFSIKAQTKSLDVANFSEKERKKIVLMSDFYYTILWGYFSSIGITQYAPHINLKRGHKEVKKHVRGR